MKNVFLQSPLRPRKFDFLSILWDDSLALCPLSKNISFPEHMFRVCHPKSLEHFLYTVPSKIHSRRLSKLNEMSQWVASLQVTVSKITRNLGHRIAAVNAENNLNEIHKFAWEDMGRYQLISEPHEYLQIIIINQWITVPIQLRCNLYANRYEKFEWFDFPKVSTEEKCFRLMAHMTWNIRRIGWEHLFLSGENW